MEDNQNSKTSDGSKQVELRADASAAGESTKKHPRIHWRLIRDIVFGIGIFAGVSVIVWHTAEWLQSRVDQAVTSKLSDDKVLRQIAAQIKPSLIFDGKESIVSDMGASQFVKDIRVTKRT
ncbi:MAG: hypothetical protein ABSA83_18510 [Verrucomicrobiota bacterium]|jgi:hypothetical protein